MLTELGKLEVEVQRNSLMSQGSRFRSSSAQCAKSWYGGGGGETVGGEEEEAEEEAEVNICFATLMLRAY